MDDLRMDEKLARLRRCRREMDGLKQEAEAIEAEVKAELEARGVEQVETAHPRHFTSAPPTPAPQSASR